MAFVMKIQARKDNPFALIIFFGSLLLIFNFLVPLLESAQPGDTLHMYGQEFYMFFFFLLLLMFLRMTERVLTLSVEGDKLKIFRRGEVIEFDLAGVSTFMKLGSTLQVGTEHGRVSVDLAGLTKKQFDKLDRAIKGSTATAAA